MKYTSASRRTFIKRVLIVSADIPLLENNLIGYLIKQKLVMKKKIRFLRL